MSSEVIVGLLFLIVSVPVCTVMYVVFWRGIIKPMLEWEKEQGIDG